MSVSMKLSGKKEVQDAIQAVIDTTNSKSLHRAVRKAFEPVYNTAREKVKKQTGTLHDDIHMEVRKRGSVVTVGLVITGVGASRWHLNEFGDKYEAPRPFIRPAWDEHNMSFEYKVGNEIGPSMSRAFSSGKAEV